MAIYKTFEVALELKQTSTNPTFSVTEGDTGNQIKITVTDGGSALDLTGCRVIAVFSKSNGISMQDSGVEDGGITIGGVYNNEVTVSMFKSSLAPGNIECELQIYSGEDMSTLVTTARFNFICRRAMMNEDVLLGTNEYPLLVDLISTVEGFVDVEAARVLAEQGRVAAENIRNENEDIRNQNELARISDEARRDEAEAERVSNENERIAASARFNNLSVTVDMLPNNQQPTASVTDLPDGKRISLGIPKGKDGEKPVRGEDYWTEADQDAIVNDVLSALPIWKGGSF